MKLAATGFEGSRLREAREARGVTAVALAELAKVTPQAINNYENNRSTPSPRVADVFAEALGLPLDFFFLAPRRGQPYSPFLFRSMSAATKTARVRAVRRAYWLSDLHEYLGTRVTFPDVNLPQFDLPASPSLITDDEIEEIADAVRDYWRMRRDPVANMVALLENQGAVVSRGPLGDASLDGLSVSLARPIVMIGTDKGTAVRWRFDAAHELGHLILHSHLDPNIALKPAEHKLVEHQAHRFAGAFLLPMSSFGEDFFAASLDALLAIKPKWRVSIAAMIMRARDGQLISEEIQRRLHINYTRRGWRRMEPYDDHFEAERPSVIGTAIKLVVDNGDKPELVQRVPLASADVEALAGLPSGWLGGQGAAPVQLRPRQEELPLGQGSDSAVIYPFRRTQRD